MKNKKRITLGIVLFLSIFLIGIVSASYCCEKTIDDIDLNTDGNQGGYCVQIEEESLCAIGFLNVPISCEGTSYCKTGTCIDSVEGTCMSGPEATCDGLWNEKDKKDIPQCQKGCCVLGDEVSLVTQIACEKQSSAYGLTTNFLANVQTENQCLASANPSAKGACEYEENYQLKCYMTTKEECLNSDMDFHEGLLCSAPILENICGPRGGTECVDEKDEVYFLDTCGNVANVYDYSQIDKDSTYWTYLQAPSCDDGDGNKESSSCGFCDYHAGSTCAAKKMGESVDYGDNICRDLDCKTYINADEGFSGDDYPRHYEKWCASSSGVGSIFSVEDSDEVATISGGEDYTTSNLPGSQYYVKSCYNGEVSIEPCSDYRQEVCVESEKELDNGKIFSYATCRKSQWEDCFGQITEETCINRLERNCQWIEDGYYFSDEGLKETEKDEDPEGICVPLYAPGFDTKSADAKKNGGNVCGLASSICVVTYEEKWKLFGDYDTDDLSSLSLEEKKDLCITNCHCLEEDWKNTINNMCTALGDCGNKGNLIGVSGIETELVIIPATELQEEE